MRNFKPLTFFFLVFIFTLACGRIFIKTHSAENECYRTGKYTVSRHVGASFSTEILQAVAVKGLIFRRGDDESGPEKGIKAVDRIHVQATKTRRMNDGGVRICFGSPFSSKIVVCGHLSCDFVPHNYETLKGLSSLPTLMQESFRW